LLSQKKETKEKATPYRFHPALLIIMGGNLKLASLKQSIADTPMLIVLLGSGNRGLKTIEGSPADEPFQHAE
jgi:hypothetical protein